MIGLMPYRRRVEVLPWVLISDTTAVTYPAGLQNGDLGILLEAHYSGSSTVGYNNMVGASGWTTIDNVVRTGTYLGPGQNAVRSYWSSTAKTTRRELTASLSGTAIGGNATTRRLLIFRHPKPGALVIGTLKATENTLSFSGAVNFSSEPGGIILPMFSTVLATDSTQGAGSITFDGATPSIYATSAQGAYAMIGMLTGIQAPRSINIAMSGGVQAAAHSAINIRPKA